MTVPALFSCLLFLERVEKRSGAGLGSRSVPPRLRRCSCGRGLLVLGPARTPERQRVGPARCRGNRQTPVPGTARAPLPQPLRGCGPCAWYSFKRRSGSITVANWMLAPPRAQLENAFEKGATMITGSRRAMGNRIGTPYAAGAAMQGVELLREFTKIRRYHLPCRMRPSCSLVRAESAQIRLIC